MFSPHGVVESAVELSDARVLVAGLGVTGQAVAAALRDRVAQVITTAPAPKDPATTDVAPDVELPQDDRAIADLLEHVDLVVTSPGFRPASPLLAAATDAGIPIWSELELAWRLRVNRRDTDTPAPWLVVTGTNGKTTTVLMLEGMLTAAGLRARAVGNVGTPLIEAALDPDLDVLAIEASSFQLHYTHTMAAQAAAVLNIAADHLDWHGSLPEYAGAKGRAFERVEVAAIYNAADALTEELADAAHIGDKARRVAFTLGTPRVGQLGLVEELLVDRAFHTDPDHPDHTTSAVELATAEDFVHLGGVAVAPHNVANALAAAGLARAHGVAPHAVAQALRDFAPGEHRIARVATIDDVDYVDDSKATNAHAASASLQAFPDGSVVWIVGGLAKGAEFFDLVKANVQRLRAAVLIGVDQRPFSQALARHAPNIPVVAIDPGETEVMRRAVAAARDLAQPGDTVLLAPAGASQDQFKSYAHRGEAFAEAVGML